MLEKILFYLLIFALPFQTRVIFYQGGQQFNEWHSAFFYATDGLIIFILFLWLFRLRVKFLTLCKLDKALYLFLLVALISLFKTQDLPLGVYQGFKLLEFSFLFLYVKYNFSKLFNLRKVAQVIVASGLLQSLIALVQFVQQKSLGLKILGESVLGPVIPGVAKIDLVGFKLIRSYGTLPHSNLLAVFLVITIFSLLYLYFRTRPQKLLAYAFLASYFLLVFALFTTFSRSFILIFWLMSLAWFWFFRSYSQIKLPLVLFFAFNFLFLIMLWPELAARFDFSTFIEGQSVNLRLLYNQIAWQMIKFSPFLGVGLGNFVGQLPIFASNLSGWMLQPVHNVFLLIGAETGLMGLIIFLYFFLALMGEIISRFRSKFFFLLFLGCFLLLLLSDHYFWTLQQGRLVFWLGLGLLSRRQIKNQRKNN